MNVPEPEALGEFRKFEMVTLADADVLAAVPPSVTVASPYIVLIWNAPVVES